MGSVKDLKVLSSPTSYSAGEGLFQFSDRYSVFDWGEMPDTIPDKGMATALLGAYFFEILEKYEIKTHYKGLLEDRKTVKLNKLKKPSKFMKASIFRVIEPVYSLHTYEYEAFQEQSSNFLIPLEIIYRNSLPEGSSVFKRLKNGDISIEDLGLYEEPQPNALLHRPMVDFSTKLEVTDRYISIAEAQEIAAIENEEMQQLVDLVLDINDIITNEYKRISAINLDGKIETAFDPKRQITLVDVLGTLDECRFELYGVHLSKEVARKYYRTTDWYFETERAKQKDRLNWKKECTLQPEPLPTDLKELISFMYCEVTNQITGRKWFDIPLSLNTIVTGIKTYIQ